MCSKKCGALCLAVLLLLLSGCTGASSGEAKLYAGSAAAGSRSSSKSAEVTKDTLSKSYTVSLQVVFLSESEIRLKAQEAQYVETLVKIGDTVSKGDVLAVFSGQEDTAKKTEYSLSITELKNEKSDGEKEYEERIEDLNEQLADLLEEPQYIRTTINEEILRKRIEKVRLEKEQYIFRMEKKIRDMQEALEKLQQEENDLQVTSPMDGVVATVEYLTPGETCYEGQSVVTLYDPDSILLYSGDNVSGTLRYGQEVEGTITYGKNAYGVKGEVISADDLLPDVYDFGGALIRPTTMEGVDLSSLGMVSDKIRGFSFSGTATEFTVRNALLVPKDALYYTNNAAYVYVLENDTPHLTYVQTGPTDGKNVVILSGLTQGQTVALN